MMLFGRRKIYCSTDIITADNVIAEVNDVLSIHSENIAEMDYLYWYRRGMQPILERTKEVRPEINSKVTVNNADMVVTFKNGYFLTKPASYVSRREDVEITSKVSTLNEYIYLSGKHEADNEVIDWFHTVGLGDIYVEPNDDEEQPFSVYSLDPRSSCVGYSLRPGNAPVMGLNIVLQDEQIVVDCYTRSNVFRLDGGKFSKDDARYGFKPTLKVNGIISIEPNYVGEIPIIEYQYNSQRMGAFENSIDIMDAINETESNRQDGIKQFIQSLVVLYNCELEEGTTANTIRQNGLIELKSVGENKADVKILSEQLDQIQTQTTLDNLYEQMLDKCGVPSITRNEGGTSDNGSAVYLRNGWQMADTHARNTEDAFKKSNALFDKVVLAILRRRGFTLRKSDFELKIVRNDSNGLIAKSQAAMNMKELGFAPAIAFERSGLSNDPLADIEVSKRYIQMKWDNVPTEDESIEVSSNALEGTLKVGEGID